MNQGEDSTPTKYYAMSALTYLVAMVTSNKALTWVNYPTQVKDSLQACLSYYAATKI